MIIILSCLFQRELNYSLTKVYTPITEAFGINVRSLYRENQKLHQFYTINGINVRVKPGENGPPESITHMFDLVNIFPDIDIDSL